MKVLLKYQIKGRKRWIRGKNHRVEFNPMVKTVILGRFEVVLGLLRVISGHLRVI